MKIFIISQFNYCPLVGMFYSRKLNHRISIIHDRVLRITYQDDESTFLQQKDNSVKVHQRNLKVLATELFKSKNDLSHEIMKEAFEFKEPSYSLRSKEN